MISVTYCLTRDFTAKAVPSIRSLLEHNPDAVIYVVTEEDDDGLPFDTSVINITGQKYIRTDGPNYYNPFKYINLLKPALPEILPLDKVIFLDADTIVCDDLTPMWETDLTGKWVAAVPEYRGAYKPFGDLYFNAGVMVMNLKQMREDNPAEDMLRYLNTVPQPYADQDAFNKYALEQDKFVELPLRYNENFATGYTDAPAIVHFCGISDWWTSSNMFRREYLARYR